MGKSKKQKVGESYFFGLHIILCHGPVDAVKRIIFGEKNGWKGNVTKNEDIFIFLPTLFGPGDREGGISGTVNVLMGDKDQPINTYLHEKFFTLIDGEKVVSTYRHLTSLVFNHFYMGNSPQPPAISVEVERIKTGWDGNPIWNTAAADCGNGLNPAHIIYELMCCPEWGAGSSAIEKTQLKKVAAILQAEKFGLNIVWHEQQPINEFINDVLRHIDGYPCNDAAGNYFITLCRDDYDVSKLPVISAEIKKIKKIKRSSGADLYNQLTLIYTDADTGKDASVEVRDHGLIKSMGRTRGRKIKFKMINDPVLAKRIAMRELHKLSTPILSFDFEAMDSACKYYPGQVVRLIFAPANVDHVVRIIKNKRGDIKRPGSMISAVEDIFSMSPDAYKPPRPSDWENPIKPPKVISQRHLIEASYWLLSHQMPRQALQSMTSIDTIAVVLARKEQGIDYNYTIEMLRGSKYKPAGAGRFTPTLTIFQALTRFATSLHVNSIRGMLDLDFPAYAQIDNEIISVDSIDVAKNTVHIRRGCLDSLPQAHPPGSIVWFPGLSDMGVIAEQFANGIDITLKLLTNNPMGQLPIDAAPVDKLSLSGRQGRPLPPANIKLNGHYFPDLIDTDTMALTWSCRNRKTQIAQRLIDWTEANVTPETNQITVIEVGLAGKPPYFSKRVAGSSPSRITIPFNSTGPCYLRMYAERNDSGAAISSFITYEHTFLWSGYGAGYGKRYGGMTKT